MKEIIKMLDEKLKYEHYEIIGDEIHIYVKSKKKVQECQQCECKTRKVHSEVISRPDSLPASAKK